MEVLWSTEINISKYVIIGDSTHKKLMKVLTTIGLPVHPSGTLCFLKVNISSVYQCALFSVI